MTRGRRVAGAALVTSCVVLSGTACAFHGINSVPLPGTVAGSDGDVYHVELADVGALESNSPVMMGDVVVGTVRQMVVDDWRAQVDVSVRKDVEVPANAVASVGQTSLLGSMHLALDPPVGEKPEGRLSPGASIGLAATSTFPSTEETLASLSVIVNGGGLGQVGDIIREFNAALNGREGQMRDVLTRLNDFVGLLAEQRDDVNASIASLNRLAGTLNGQREVITAALNKIPPAIDVLVQQQPRITEMLNKFREFSDVATGLIRDTQDDLVRNLTNLEPTLRALADVGPDLGTVLAYAPTFPYTQNFIDRAIRGDFMNLFITFDFTVPRLKRTLFLGTRWGQEGAAIVPAPGDPWYSMYTLDPMSAPITPVPAEIAPIPELVDTTGGAETAVRVEDPQLGDRTVAVPEEPVSGEGDGN
ncbi:MCE family protein [Mycolicibacterium sp. P9-22]|uniref:MCE family protein n=1 Tax=Mycolicibacterium sp. P9-22 TaxID=2024613 RepID=UPI0011EF349E|nr:MCE family protein [Mycolicibacterium sp. P9-22]KAA0114615.1 MCE family protein [Mycolicibacterium sp. P9-22]